MKLQFSLAQLFIAITAVSVGGGFAWRLYEGRSNVMLFGERELWLLCGAMIGVGIGQLFPERRKAAMIGAAIGFAGAAVLCAVWACLRRR